MLAARRPARAQVYGSDAATLARLRAGAGGRLALAEGGALLPLNDRGFGDAGANQNWWLVRSYDWCLGFRAWGKLAQARALVARACVRAGHCARTSVIVNVNGSREEPKAA